ncbi:MAG: Ribonucleotide reductase of class Ia (aerobic), alpha subunit, partial [uncultured Microvirga sp.]
AEDLRPRPLDPHPDGPHRDRRALPRLLRPCEQGDAGPPQAGRARGQDLQPLLRDHPADRARPAWQGPHRRLLPLLPQPRDLVRVEGRPALHPGRDALPRQRAAELHRHRAGQHGEGQVFGDARALRRPRRDGLPQLPPGAERALRERGGKGVEQADVQAHPRGGRCRQPPAGRGARALPGCRRIRLHGALLEQNGDRAHGL